VSDTVGMDRRTSPRVTAVRPVKLTLLGDKDRTFDVQLRDFSQGGACIGSATPFACGAPVRLDLDDSLLLGEIVHCRQEGTDYQVGLRFEQCIGRVSDLQRLVGALVGKREVAPTARTAA
jgi:hypothetical protein